MTSLIRAENRKPENRVSTFFWNIGTYTPIYTASDTKTPQSSWIMCWGPCILVQFVLITNLTHISNVFISFLYMFRGIQCSSPGESIVSIHHLVYITLCVCVCGRLVCRPYRNSLTCIPGGHTHTEWYIRDDVLIQLILLVMSTGLLETCREVK